MQEREPSEKDIPRELGTVILCKENSAFSRHSEVITVVSSENYFEDRFSLDRCYLSAMFTSLPPYVEQNNPPNTPNEECFSSQRKTQQLNLEVKTTNTI